MARRRSSKNGGSGKGCLIVVIITGILGVLGAMADLIKNNAALFAVGVALVIAAIVAYLIITSKINKQREELFTEILDYLNLRNINDLLREYDDQVIVKSKQALEKYDGISYLKERNSLDTVKGITGMRFEVNQILSSFLNQNDFKERPQYQYVENQLRGYLALADGYRVRTTYITSAGNNRGDKLITFLPSQVQEIEEHPEYLMTKGEYNRFLKQQAKDELDSKKHDYYDRVNSIIDFANTSKESLIVKSRIKKLDELIQQLFDRTINSIQKIRQLDSDEWNMLDSFITGIDDQIQTIVREDNKISEFYQSDDFKQIKETCNSLNESRKDFNEYIEEKAQSISKLFGTRIVRTETQNEDTYN